MFCFFAFVLNMLKNEKTRSYIILLRYYDYLENISFSPRNKNQFKRFMQHILLSEFRK